MTPALKSASHGTGQPEGQHAQSEMERSEAPPIAALFHVIFDQKVGWVSLAQWYPATDADEDAARYTIAWQRSIADLDLSGVEYHSLPSGLHGVKSDTVYFIHDGEYAGVSAFAQQEADSAHRNATFCAVGALVPLSYGRLGKSWLHAPELRRLAHELVKHTNDKRGLELFWKKCRQDGKERSSSHEPRRESLVAGLRHTLFDARDGLGADSGIAADHPALYMPAFLESFGPLVFPLYRAALLRKRILLLGTPPVQRNCHAVYALSILSSIPQPAAEMLQPNIEPLLRSQALFSVGIPDIGTLSAESSNGWIATTTDDILGEKHALYDVVVDLSLSELGTKRRWPRLRTSDGKVVKATQRDLRRYRLLRNELKRIRQARRGYLDEPAKSSNASQSEDQVPLLDPQQFLREPAEPEEMLNGESEVVEPMSWAAAAYNSYIWWASAGSTLEPVEAEEEAQLERELLGDLPALHDAVAYATPSSSHSGEEERLLDAQETATIMTAYFHRLTTHLITSLVAIVEEADDETEAGIEEGTITVTANDVREMGLDVWSSRDKESVAGMMKTYFGHTAAVAEGGVTMCGVRVC